MTDPSSTSLAGKVCVVTGASRGIGRAIATRLAAEGATVAWVARDGERVSAARGTANSPASIAIGVDLRESSAAQVVRERVLAELHRCDVLVNCAGATKVGDFLSFNEDDWADGFALKFSAARRLSAAFWPDLMASRGTILNIVGSAGRTPGPEYAIGGSVNAALLALTKALAARGIRDGVRVNAINPGPVRTDRLQGHLQRMAAEQGVSLDEAAERLRATYGVARFGEPEDVAALAAFIVSGQGRLLQGSLIDLDGGLTKSL
jgi:NAD(P)-dependent dehydrogenase (short-subunit alcohol dehydrogenase family)